MGFIAVFKRFADFPAIAASNVCPCSRVLTVVELKMWQSLSSLTGELTFPLHSLLLLLLLFQAACSRPKNFRAKSRCIWRNFSSSVNCQPQEQKVANGSRWHRSLNTRLPAKPMPKLCHPEIVFKLDALMSTIYRGHICLGRLRLRMVGNWKLVGLH